MKTQPANLLEAGLRSLGLEVSAAVQAQLLAYLAELEKWNSAYNLTAIRDAHEMVIKHLLDSLSILPLLPHGRMLDVGSGAGLPGIPVAILRPECSVTTLDSNGKKTRFMRHVQRAFGLKNLQVAEARAEQFQAPAFDVIVSRAYASLEDFFASTVHLMAPTGIWLAMKGKLDPAELAAIPKTVRILRTHRLQVPHLNEERHAVLATPQP